MSTAESAALAVEQVRISYGSTVAVDAVTFNARPGAVTALLGPNGAGKTSLIEACVGLRRITSGAISVLGRSHRRLTSRDRARVGVMLQDGGLPMGLTPVRALSDRARLYDSPADVAALCAQLGIETTGSIRSLSGGEFKRVALAMALVGNPDLVFLDEPAAGLDPWGRDLMLTVIDALRMRGTAVLLTSHMLDDVEKIADHVVIMNRGVVVANASVASLTHQQHEAVTFSGPMHVNLSSLLQALPSGSTAKEVGPGRYMVSTNSETVNPSTLATITAWCAQHDVIARELSVGRQTLEDVYRNLTS